MNFCLRAALLLVTILTFATGAAGEGTPDAAAATSERQVVEIRLYNLKPGTREQFHKVVVERAMPLLLRFDVDVVAFGPSLHDTDSYFLMRAFADAAARRETEDAFYGSAEWRDGPRDDILSYIESYATTVVTLDAATVDGLRRIATPQRDGG